MSNQNKDAYIGIDYGGYDGNKFCMCVLVEGVVVNVTTCYSEEEFNREVEKVFNMYNTKHILIEKHDKYRNKNLDYAKRLHT